MKFSKKTNKADTIVLSISMIILFFVIVLIVTKLLNVFFNCDTGLLLNFSDYLLKNNQFLTIIQLITGVILIGVYDLYLYKDLPENKNYIEYTNVESRHHNYIKSLVLIFSAISSVLILLYNFSPEIIGVILIIYIIVTIKIFCCEIKNRRR
ncbi:hypothetical protein [Staphylococcus intermedius]|uniref:hypothetical protein n=1 Tax=Staphylococcus intermedius TaxID=1285 RepID=UPI000BBCC936|nr:hypothetical protein [Staphylococcus intermedius]PCF86202.1 hypothetical protein B4W76_08110 [Staphylococcus intermedius]